MRYVLLVLAPVALLSLEAHGEPRGYAFDPKTGTEFRWHVDDSGTKHIAAFNRAQRSIWNLTIDPEGNRSGTDENGNFWTFDLNTNVYRNANREVFCLIMDTAPVCLTP